MTKENKLRKRLYTIAAALGLAVGSVGVAGAASSNNLPAPPASEPQVETQEPAYTGSIQAPAEDEATDDATDTEADEAAESVQLEGLATITSDEAAAAALAAVPGEVGEVELDNENGSVVYSVEIIDASGAEVDVVVDAGNGSILAQQADNEADELGDDNDADEEHEGNDVNEEHEDGVEDQASETTPAG